MKSYVDKNKLQEYTTKLTNKYKTLFASKGTEAAIGSPLVAHSVAEMTDTNKVYVYVGSESGYTAGDWYYYNGSAWASGGVYNSVAVDTDATLTVSGQAADSAAVGTALSGKQGTLTFDDTPTQNSSNPVTSGGIYAAIQPDNTLSVSGKAADAKITGDKVSVINDIIEIVPPNLYDSKKILDFEGWSAGTDDYEYYGRLSYLGTLRIDESYEENTRYTVSLSAHKSGNSSSGNGLQIKVKYTDSDTSVTLITFANSTTSYSNKHATTASGRTVQYIYCTYSSGGTATWYIKNLQIEKGTSATAFVPYTLSAKDQIVRNELNINVIKYLLEDEGEDLKYSLTPVNGVTLDGTFTSSSNWREFTFVYDPKCYYVFPWQPTINLYYGDNTFRKTIRTNTDQTPFVLNNLSLGDGGYVKVATHIDNLSNFHIKKFTKHLNSNWMGKTCKIFGDSIMAGNWAKIENVMQKVKNPFGEAACAELGINVLSNNAVGGACFGQVDGHSYIYDQVSNLESNSCNLVLLRGGGNDFTYNTPIGSIETMQTDTNTLYSEMYKVVNKIMTACPGAVIVMITMLHRGVKLTNPTSYVSDYLPTATNGLGLKLKDYRDAIINFCENMGIPYCDMFSDAMLNPIKLNHALTVNYLSEIPEKIYADPAPWFYQDRQHALERAHERMAHLLVDTINKTISMEVVNP